MDVNKSFYFPDEHSHFPKNCARGTKQFLRDPRPSPKREARKASSQRPPRAMVHCSSTTSVSIEKRAPYLLPRSQLAKLTEMAKEENLSQTILDTNAGVVLALDDRNSVVPDDETQETESLPCSTKSKIDYYAAHDDSASDKSHVNAQYATKSIIKSLVMFKINTDVRQSQENSPETPNQQDIGTASLKNTLLYQFDSPGHNSIYETQLIHGQLLNIDNSQVLEHGEIKGLDLSKSPTEIKRSPIESSSLQSSRCTVDGSTQSSPASTPTDRKSVV